MTAQRTSAVGIALIKRSEALRLAVYLDAAGHPTIGWGHLIRPEDGIRTQIDAETAEGLLESDVEAAESAVQSLVQVPLTQGQFDALVDFVFNLGRAALLSSTLQRKLNAGDYAGARDEFGRWVFVHADGQAIEAPGLVTRRAAEVALWDGTNE